MNAVPTWISEADAMPVDAEVASLRMPPHSIEAEQSVLGGLLIDNDAWDRIGGLLQEDDFYRAEHRAAFAAIGQQIAACQPADIVTVFDRLQAAGTAPECSLAYLNALAQSVASASNIRRYAEIVRERSILRKLVATSDEIAASAFNPGERTVSQIVAEAEDKIVAINALRDRGGVGPRAVASMVVDRLAHYDAIGDGSVESGSPTGIHDLDVALNGGLQPGRVYVVAARPSVGKSAFALQIALARASAGDPTLFLTMEMPAEEVFDRAVSNLGCADYGWIQSRGRRGQGDDAITGVLDATDQLLRMPLWIDDQPGLTVAGIRAKVLAMRRSGLKLLVIDYLQLCAGTGGRGTNRNSEIEEITRGIKTLAKQMQISVVLLSQLSRDVEKRASPEPTLADLRDSGAIEQDADVVLFLWRVRPLGERQVMGLGIAKNRQGERGQRIPLEFVGRHQRWHSSTADISPQREPSKPSKSFE